MFTVRNLAGLSPKGFLDLSNLNKWNNYGSNRMSQESDPGLR